MERLHGTEAPMEFRFLRRSDVPGYLKVVLLGMGTLEHATGLDRTSGAMVRRLSRRSTWFLLGVLRLVGRSPVDIMVGVDGDRIAGTGMLVQLPSCSYVAGMVTDPDYRGRGVASRILGILRERAVRRHRAWLLLDVDGDNALAIEVYRRAGYREAGRLAWYARSGVSPTSPAGAQARPATKREVEAVLPTLDAARVADYRAALPATTRMLSHAELLISGRGVRWETWVRRFPSGSSLAVRAGFSPEASLGIYCPMAGPVPPLPEEVAGLFDPGTEWLRSFEPASCMAVVAEPVGAIGPSLESLGFSRVGSTVTMLRQSRA